MFLLQAQLGELTGKAVEAGQSLQGLAGDYTVLVIGVLLVIAAIVIIQILKNILVNSVLGLIAWAVLNFVLEYRHKNPYPASAGR